MRSGFFTSPSPLVEFDCESQSTSRTGTSAAASEAARLMAVVVLPTPPFWLATAMILPMGEFKRREYPKQMKLGNAAFWCKGPVFLRIRLAPADMFHVEQLPERLKDISYGSIVPRGTVEYG